MRWKPEPKRDWPRPGNPVGIGALGVGLDFWSRRWVRAFEVDYSRAKQIMAALDAEQIPNRLAIPDGLPHLVVVVEVMRRSLPKARRVVVERPRSGSTARSTRPSSDSGTRP
jgi:hypothetical protein